MSDEPLYPECPHCEEAVLPWDDQRDTNGDTLIFHADCLLRTVVGSLGHLQKRCSCFGGSEDDPPGMTLREAAKAAADYFRETQPGSEGPTPGF